MLHIFFTNLSGKIITGQITECLTLAIQTKWLNFRFCKSKCVMNQAQDKYSHTRKVLLVILSILAVIPLGPLINRYIPPLIIGDWNLDLTVSIILAGTLTFLTLRLFRFLLLPAVGLLILVLIYNQL